MTLAVANFFLFVLYKLHKHCHNNFIFHTFSHSHNISRVLFAHVNFKWKEMKTQKLKRNVKFTRQCQKCLTEAISFKFKHRFNKFDDRDPKAVTKYMNFQNEN